MAVEVADERAVDPIPLWVRGPEGLAPEGEAEGVGGPEEGEDLYEVAMGLDAVAGAVEDPGRLDPKDEGAGPLLFSSSSKPL